MFNEACKERIEELKQDHQKEMEELNLMLTQEFDFTR
jgi:hypothetical protein